MDTPENKTDIVFNDDARKLPDGTINLTGQWSAIQTVPLALSLVNRPTGLEDLQLALKTHIEERLYADGIDFAYLAPITVSELPKSAMADRYGATAFIVRTSLTGAKDGEYFTLDVLETEHREETEVSVYAGNFKRVEVAGHGACWLLVSGMYESAAASVIADTVDNGADMELKQEGEQVPESEPDVPSLPFSTTETPVYQLTVQVDKNDNVGYGVFVNGQAEPNPDALMLLNVLHGVMGDVIAGSVARRNMALQAAQQSAQQKPSGLVVASANTPLPPMPRMNQKPRRN